MEKWTWADVIVLTTLELEYAAVKRVDAGAVAGTRWVAEQRDGLPIAMREFVGAGGRSLRFLVTRVPDAFTRSVLSTLLVLVDELRPACIAMCGVCVARTGKAKLGDVVIAEQLYDCGADKDHAPGLVAPMPTYSLRPEWRVAAESFHPGQHFGDEAWWQARPVPYEWQGAWVLRTLHEGVTDPASLPEAALHCPQWSAVIEHLRTNRDVTWPGPPGKPVLTEQGRTRALAHAARYPTFPDLSPGGAFMPFQIHVHPIGCGSAMRDDDTVWAYIAPHIRRTLGLEMESSTATDSARHRADQDRFAVVVMKSVAELASVGGDNQHFKDYAARASAECLVTFLREQVEARDGAGAALSPARLGRVAHEVAAQRSDTLGDTSAIVADANTIDAAAGGVSTALGEPGKPRGGDDDRSTGKANVDHIVLYDRLIKLRVEALDELVLRARVPNQFLSPSTVPIATRASELARLSEHDPALCDRLMRLLDEQARAYGGPPSQSRRQPTSASHDRTHTPSVELQERLARMKREVTATLKSAPRACHELARRLTCDPLPEDIASKLETVSGGELAGAILAASDAQPSTPGGNAARDALHGVLCIVLPYASDWRAVVAECFVSGSGQRDVVEVRYRSDTIAEAVMAGSHGRRCLFEYRTGIEPYGRPAVQYPAAAQTALFGSEDHLLAEVVRQLKAQLGVDGLTLEEQRIRVQAELETRGEREGPERLRYYFVFRDEASQGNVDEEWGLARSTFHREGGLPGLALVRMRGRLQPSEARLESHVAKILSARTPPRS